MSTKAKNKNAKNKNAATCTSLLDLDDGLTELEELIESHARPAIAALETAKTVESKADLIANLDDAIDNLNTALDAAEALRWKL